MSMLVVFFFVAIALIAVAWRRRTLVAFSLSMAVTLFVLVGGGLLPRIGLTMLQKHGVWKPEWKTRNAIIVLGFGTTRWATGEVTTQTLAASHVVEASRLYFSCKKVAKVCRLLLTGGDPSQTGLSEAEALAHDFKALGIDESDIVIEPRAHNTWENAKFIQPMWSNGEFEQTVIVTSGIHLSRALLYFKYFGIKAEGAPSDQVSAIISILPVATNFAFFDFVIHEYLGVLYYKVERWKESHGSGPKESP